MFHGKLKMFRYKTSFLQQLLSENYRLPLVWAQHIGHELINGSRNLEEIIFSDESISHTNEVVNKQIAKNLGRRERLCCPKDLSYVRKGHCMP